MNLLLTIPVMIGDIDELFQIVSIEGKLFSGIIRLAAIIRIGTEDRSRINICLPEFPAAVIVSEFTPRLDKRHCNSGCIHTML